MGIVYRYDVNVYCQWTSISRFVKNEVFIQVWELHPCGCIRDRWGITRDRDNFLLGWECFNGQLIFTTEVRTFFLDDSMSWVWFKKTDQIHTNNTLDERKPAAVEVGSFSIIYKVLYIPGGAWFMLVKCGDLRYAAKTVACWRLSMKAY